MKHTQNPLSPLIILILMVILPFTSVLYAQTVAEPPANYDDENAGTIENPYQITNLANLRWLSETEEFNTIYPEPQTYHYFVQTADIDASETVEWNEGRGFKPIGFEQIFVFRPDAVSGAFFGSYNGNNHTISGLHIRYRDDDLFFGDPALIGFFGITRNSEIINVHLENISYVMEMSGGYSSHGSAIGALAGVSDNVGTISNCSATGDIQLLGQTAWVFSVGGLIGTSGYNQICNCFSNVDIRYNVNFQYYNGYGFVGLGGLVGCAYFAQITDSFYYGDIINAEYAYWQGGLVGFICYSDVENCYVASRREFVYASGLFGSVHRTFPENPITTVSNTFWDVNSTGVSLPYYYISEGLAPYIDAIGLTTEQMKQEAIYVEAGWDMRYTWDINPQINNGYPYLQSNPPPVSDKDKTVASVAGRLLGNYPNPFNPSTTISFDVAHEGMVMIDIYNVRGQKVRSLVSGVYGAGVHSVVWNGCADNGVSVGSGVYFYRMACEGYVSVKKMVMVK